MAKSLGGSSGIGRAMAELCLELGAKVIIGDVNPPLPGDLPITNNLQFIKTNLASWESMLELFDAAKVAFGNIDLVFANTGITSRTNFLASTLNRDTSQHQIYNY